MAGEIAANDDGALSANKISNSRGLEGRKIENIESAHAEAGAGELAAGKETIAASQTIGKPVGHSCCVVVVLYVSVVGAVDEKNCVSSHVEFVSGGLDIKLQRLIFSSIFS